MFGPAVNKAVKIEQQGKCKKGQNGKWQQGESKHRMPAIVIDQSAADDLKKFKHLNWPHDRYTFEDEYERCVLNIVPASVFSCCNNVANSINQYQHILRHLEVNQTCKEHLEKWQYAKKLFDQQWQKNVEQFIQS